MAILYQYKCDNCETEFEAWNSLENRSCAKCSNCGAIARKVFSIPNITWKDWVLDGLTHDTPRRSHDPYIE